MLTNLLGSLEGAMDSKSLVVLAVLPLEGPIQIAVEERFVGVHALIVILHTDFGTVSTKMNSDWWLVPSPTQSRQLSH